MPLTSWYRRFADVAMKPPQAMLLSHTGASSFPARSMHIKHSLHAFNPSMHPDCTLGDPAQETTEIPICISSCCNSLCFPKRCLKQGVQDIACRLCIDNAHHQYHLLYIMQFCLVFAKHNVCFDTWGKRDQIALTNLVPRPTMAGAPAFLLSLPSSCQLP